MTPNKDEAILLMAIQESAEVLRESVCSARDGWFVMRE